MHGHYRFSPHGQPGPGNRRIEAVNALRTRLTLLLATVLIVSTGLSLVAYVTGSREEDRLEYSFSEQLSFFGDLPVERTRLRQIDLDADNYLITRRTAWLQRRDRAIGEFRRAHLDLAARLGRSPQSDEWRAVGAAFERYVKAQDVAIARAKAGAMTREEALRLSLEKDQVEALVERMSRFSRLGFERLDVERLDARRATLSTFAFVLVMGLFGAVAVSLAASRILVAPILRLRDQAAGWSLGRPWPGADEATPGEIGELTDAIRAMAAKLNEQFERERQTSALKSQLVSGVSHEFNNALAVIHSAQALLRQTEPSAEAAPWHDMLAANVRALSAMATNLLNLGRLESGRFSVETSRVELGPLLKGALERLSIIGSRKNLTLSLELPPDLPPVSADPDAVGLVVANLLTNAFKYTHEGGAVVLGAAPRADGRVEVFVRDSGIGVAPEEREKIFGGWYRSERGKREAKGFGVGLALSRMILEAHGASLELESEVGRGSRFSFALERCATAAPPAPAPAA
jgi:signal transduction histidine kinase